VRKPSLAIAGLLALAACVVALAAGCGTGGKASSTGDAQNGSKQFTAKCGGCHELAAAGTHGINGPNLDNAFGPPRRQGFKESTIANVVLDQIRAPSPPMPKNLVTGDDAQDVADYVAQVAGVRTAAAAPQQNSTDGKAIFTTQCASCHTLKAAGATGTVGPNLDQLKPPLALVQRQVTNGGGVMPAFKGTLTDAQITAVSKFVADNAGK
jgi:cbb3-type cytochrome c oxidase subunit III